MAAFPSSSSSSSYQQQHPFLDSSSSSIINSTINFDQPNNALFYQHMIMNVSHNEHSVFSATNKNSMDSSSVVTDHHINHLYKKSDHLLHELPPNPISMDRNKRKAKHSSSPNSAQSKDMRGKKHKKVKDCEEKKEAPTGYIHVRARRGQATDSHSLAERVRRERISERMKLLQALVPGCDKVTGKAPMLDEIINYVQSLQHQVEFLSMKLASVNPMLYDFGMDLESLMSLSSLPSPFPECSPTTTNTHPVLDNSSILLQSHIAYALPQGDKEVLWGEGVDAQTHKVINQSGITTATLFSFPLM